MYTQTKDYAPTAHSLDRTTVTSIAAPPDAKDILWSALRGKRLSEIPFRRDQIFGSITADFFSNQYHLVISVCDPGVASKHWFYAKMDAQLRHLGFRAIRFTYDDVVSDLPLVLNSIVEIVSQIARRQRRI